MGSIFRGLQARALAKGNPGGAPVQRANLGKVSEEQRSAMKQSRQAAHLQRRQEHEQKKSSRMNSRMMRRQARKKAMAGVGPG